MKEKIHALYCRVSTEMQVEGGESLQTQKDRLKGWCEAHKIPNFKVFTDAGWSAKGLDRPAISQILEEVRQGHVAAVVVTKLDRLTRSLKDLLKLVETLQEHDTGLVSITQNIDTQSTMGRFTLHMLGVIAELERGMTSDRVSESMRHRAKQGKWCGGPVPYGYKKVAGKLVPHEQNAPVVRDIYRQYTQLRSIRGVTHYLNKSGVLTARGKSWASTTIRRILTSPVYKGMVVYGRRNEGKVYSKKLWIEANGEHEPLVSQEAWSHVQEIIGQKNRKPKKGRKSYLLRSLLRCGKCGHPMYGHTSKRKKHSDREYSYYRCLGHTQRGSHVCTGNTVPMKAIEELVIANLKQLSEDKVFLFDKARILESATEDIQPRQKDLEKRITRIEQRFHESDRKKMRILELFEDGSIDRNLLTRRIQDLEKNQQNGLKELPLLRQELEALSHGERAFEIAYEELTRFAANWKHLDDKARQLAVQAIVKEVEVGDDEVIVRVWTDFDARNDRKRVPNNEIALLNGGPHGHGFIAATNINLDG